MCAAVERGMCLADRSTQDGMVARRARGCGPGARARAGCGAAACAAGADAGAGREHAPDTGPRAADRGRAAGGAAASRRGRGAAPAGPGGARGRQACGGAAGRAGAPGRRAAGGGRPPVARALPGGRRGGPPCGGGGSGRAGRAAREGRVPGARRLPGCQQRRPRLWPRPCLGPHWLGSLRLLAPTPPTRTGLGCLRLNHKRGVGVLVVVAGGLEVAVLLFGTVYGPRQDPLGVSLVARAAWSMLQGHAPRVEGDGRQERDYLFVDDAVDALARAVHTDVTGRILAGTGSPTSVLDAVEQLAARIGWSGEPEWAPARPGDPRRCVLDPGKAGKVLGWQPWTHLDEGMAITV